MLRLLDNADAIIDVDGTSTRFLTISEIIGSIIDQAGADVLLHVCEGRQAAPLVNASLSWSQMCRPKAETIYTKTEGGT